MVPTTTSLVGFNGEIKWPLGQITLLVKVGDDEHSTSAWMDFMVVRSTSPFNGIIGRPGLRKMKAEAEAAFKQMKEHISKLRYAHRLQKEQDELIVYLVSATKGSVIPTHERKGRPCRSNLPLINPSKTFLSNPEFAGRRCKSGAYNLGELTLRKIRRACSCQRLILSQGRSSAFTDSEQSDTQLGS
ncbi:hypothetical protein Tco_1499928 [Tanacetum coccineum]